MGDREMASACSWEGGPPVPVIVEGSCACSGSCIIFVFSASSKGTFDAFRDRAVSASSASSCGSVKGMSSFLAPSSSARSVMARLEVPKRNCMPRVRYAVSVNTTT